MNEIILESLLGQNLFFSAELEHLKQQAKKLQCLLTVNRMFLSVYVKAKIVTVIAIVPGVSHLSLTLVFAIHNKRVAGV